MAVLRRTRSGVRAIVPWETIEQRTGTARLGGETGRWSPMIVQMAVALAPKASAIIGPDAWVEWLDDLSEQIEAELASKRRGVGGGRTIMK